MIEKNDKKLIRKFEDINQVVTTKNWCGGYVTNARSFRGKIKNLKKKFSAILSLNYNYSNYSLPREAKIMNLPSIGVVDSNSNTEIFSYPIPINSVNFGVSRLIAYTFAVKIFKGLTKRIIGRFKKLKPVSTKLKKKNKFYKKRKIFIKLYFKKFKSKIKLKKKRIRLWFKNFNFEIDDFKKRVIRLQAEQKKRDFIEKNGQKWLTLEAASRSLKIIEKIKKLPKKKSPKKSPKSRIFKSNFFRKFYLPIKVSRLTFKKYKPLSYIRFKKIKKRKMKIKKRKMKHKKPRYRPNKKWKPRFKPKPKIISIFNRIKKKIKLLNNKRRFGYSPYSKKFKKNPKFVYRAVHADILRFKVKKIYKFLYKKRKILLIKRAKKKKKKTYKINYNYTQTSSYNTPSYNQKHNYQDFGKLYDGGKNKNYRYYYKDFAYVKKPKKNKDGRRWNRTTTASFSGLYSTIELSPPVYRQQNL